MIDFCGTGRRKSATARVRIRPGKGTIVVNGRSFESYFPREVARMTINQPLVAIDSEGKYDITVYVRGGGDFGQAGAVRLGIARALVSSNETLRPVLRHGGFLTRDSRRVERKKVGLHKSRKKPTIL